jgi:hypothetical protein
MHMHNMSETTVVIDLRYHTFTSLHLHHYQLRTLTEMVADLGGAAGWLRML